ncbi:MAG: C4-dicarboxylate-specific signal transduction histidine kinase [Sulfurimonas sp.]|uniref:sensor histidine kinase n=1 Tax=Sulfurimonas sp. TaxID=2022749 RepID=UPI0039E722A5
MKEDNEYIQNIMNEVAHQWRQPLSHINSIVFSIDSILYENGIKNKEIEKKLNEIESITKHMSKTIDDLNNKSMENDDTIFLVNVFDEITTLISSRLEKERIKLIIDVDKSISIQSNTRTLLQAIINILHNSIDALLERNIFNAYIKINVSKTEKDISIKIIDNGGGITENTMRKIFDKDYTTKHSTEGSGVGLHMTKEIIEKHLQADLNVYNIDCGVCFEINFKSSTLDEI